mgnify:CR=1 FL=1
MRQLRWVLVALAAIGCGLPKNVDRPPSSALVDTRHTTLGALTASAVAKHPGESGFLLFNTGEGAIQARVAMADVAQSSIDAQVFPVGSRHGRPRADGPAARRRRSRRARAPAHRRLLGQRPRPRLPSARRPPQHRDTRVQPVLAREDAR